MSVQCTICCTRFQSFDDLFSTQCGHVFHFPCLTQWLERSKTCPQCRQKTDSKKIHRIYLYSGSSDSSIREDAGALQERIDNLEFQIKLKEKDMSNWKSDCEKYNKQAIGLRKEIHKLEMEINQKNNQIAALKDQNKYFKDLNLENERLRTDFTRVKKQLDDFDDVKKILASCNDEIDEIIDSTSDYRKLATYISVLKRELTTANLTRRQYRERIKKLQGELNRCEVEKVAAVENMKKNLSKAYSPRQEKTIELSKIPKLSPVIIKDRDDEPDENSSLHTLKVKNLRQNSKRKLTVQNSGPNLPANSILFKKSRPAYDPKLIKSKSNELYSSDGLGSYSKIENFPVTGNVIKKSKISHSSLQKAKSSQSSILKLDDFVDLT